VSSADHETLGDHAGAGERSDLRVMVVDANPRRAARVESRLREAGFDLLCLVPVQAGLLHQIEQQAPDIIIIDLESPGRDLLESLSFISAHCPTPIVMFAEQDDPGFIAQAVDAGVTAYVVDGVQAARVKPVIDVAMAQFRQFQRLRAALASTQSELGDRKLVDRAKGLLMKHHGYTEQEAYGCMRKEAMNRSMRLVDVAARVVDRLGTRAGARGGAGGAGGS
jgi:two-component system, response regulator / RNA-binding antiterminator